MDETVEANVQVYEHPDAVRIEITLTGADHAARLEVEALLLASMRMKTRSRIRSRSRRATCW